MNTKKYILVGAKAEGGTVKQYGGVLTLSNGLVDYAKNAGYEIEVINTLRSGFEHQSLLKRLSSGLVRGYELFSLLLAARRKGVIIFAGAGLSFYERIFLAMISRLFFVPCTFFIVDGWFLEVRNRSWLKRFWIGLLLKIPNKLAASGSNWVALFKELDVAKGRIVTIRYWLPKVIARLEETKAVDVSESIRFVFVGWMIKEKGINEILSAIENLLGRYNFHFTFIGGGTMLEEVKQRIVDSRWGESVTAKGWLPPEEIEKELSAAHVFVLPSYAEGFPMSLIEAMTKGMPAICTDVGGISDSLHDAVNGYLIRPRDVEALERAMASFICHPETVRQHSIETLQIVRHNHDAEKNCRLLFDSFEVKR